jgi:hypothetical protein
VVLPVLAGVIAVNQLVVRALFDESYLELYLRYGAFVNLAVVLILLAWSTEVERLTGLISAHPGEYAASYVALCSGLLSGWGSLMSGDRARYAREVDALDDFRAAQAELPSRMAEPMQRLREVAADDPHGLAAQSLQVSEQLVEKAEETVKDPAPLHIPLGLGFVDFALSLVAFLALAVAMIGWLLLVVGVQYFVYLLAGAPARQAVGSPARTWVRVEGRSIEVVNDGKLRELPDLATESGYSAKPVTFTASIAAVLVFGLAQLVG